MTQQEDEPVDSTINANVRRASDKSIQSTVGPDVGSVVCAAYVVFAEVFDPLDNVLADVMHEAVGDSVLDLWEH